MRQDSGLSEVFSAVIMIAVLAGAIGILGVTYLSQSQPEKFPNVNFKLNYYLNNTEYPYIQLFHQGGDPLLIYDENGTYAQNIAEFYLLIGNNHQYWPIDNRNATDHFHHFRLIQTNSNDNYFNNGERLEAPLFYLESLPPIVQVVARLKNGGEKIIWSGVLEPGTSFSNGFGGNSFPACINENISFSDTSTNNPVSWEWDFGDGSSKQYIQNPIHSYNNPGSYTVTLNTTTAGGLKSSSTQIDSIIVKNIHALFSGSPLVGEEPLNVQFTDESKCNPTSWSWDLGDGSPSYSSAKNPSYQYITNGDGKPKKFSVTLTAKRGIYSDTLYKPDYITVNPKCFAPEADFSYDGRRDVDDTLFIEFTDLSRGAPENIIRWYWDFGDDTTSTLQNPTHEYPKPNYTVNLTVENDCGRLNTTSRKITFPCTNLSTFVNISPQSGPAPLVVNYTDHSDPEDKISAWRWSFGDGTTYTSTSNTTKNPPPHTYDRVGTYYVSLMVQNECGQAFYKTPIVVVSENASISGHIWDDRNLNAVEDSGDYDISGWTVNLEQRLNGTWKSTASTTTNNGDYSFNFTDISYGVFRVVEGIPSNWKVTYSNNYTSSISDNILIYNERNITGINFGNVGLHTSSIQVPSRFEYGSSYPGSKVSYPTDWQFNYSTSYNNTPKWMWADDSSGNVGFGHKSSEWPLGGGTWPSDWSGSTPFVKYVNYSNWGDSSFRFIPGFYNLYYKTGSSRYWLTSWYWTYGTTSTSDDTVFQTGFNLTVPDNTIYQYGQMRLFYLSSTSTFFDFYYPREKETIPYSINSYAEVHYVGANENQNSGNTNCKLKLPDNTMVNLPYNSYLGYNVGYWNNTKWEGQSIRLTASDLLTNSSTVYTYRNLTVDWEPLTPSITSPTNNSVVKGTVNVVAKVGGHNRDVSNVRLFVNNQSIGLMNYQSGNNTFTLSFNPEPYAGKIIPIVVQAYPLLNKGNMISSAPTYVTVNSALPIKANFTADPWSGPAPLEVAFTDLSSGGVNQWNWIFGSSNPSSSSQNPVHIFNNTGNYSVQLTVRNSSSSDTIIKNISVSGNWHNVTLITSRSILLNSGGAMGWLVRGISSSIKINNSTYIFNDSDQVQLILQKAISTGSITMAGDISDCNMTNITLIINNIKKDIGTISDIEVKDFENFHSNLTLTADRSYSAWITFVWDGAAVPVSWKRSLIIYNLMPTPDRYMNLKIGTTQSFFDGRASGYYFG